MSKFLLAIRTKDAENEWDLIKEFEMPDLPRKGDLLYLDRDGPSARVCYIDHHLNKGFAEIECVFDDLDDLCDFVACDPVGWKYRTSSVGTSYLLEEVEGTMLQYCNTFVLEPMGDGSRGSEHLM